MLNWGLLRQPANWFTILLMLLFAVVALDLASNIFQPQTSVDGQ